MIHFDAPLDLEYIQRVWAQYGKPGETASSK